MTDRIDTLTTVPVEQLPQWPDGYRAGELYVSAKYKTSGHLCPCGCGEGVVRTTSSPTAKLCGVRGS